MRGAEKTDTDAHNTAVFLSPSSSSSSSSSSLSWMTYPRYLFDRLAENLISEGGHFKVHLKFVRVKKEEKKKKAEVE